jgi:phosphatidylglycerophosphate synthase
MQQPAMPLPALQIAGSNTTRVWGMPNAERLRRLARQAGLSTDEPQAKKPRLWADQAYAFDPLWVQHLISNPGLVVCDGERPVMAHVSAEDANLLDQGVLPPSGNHIDIRSNPEIYNHSLRKQQQPFCALLTPENVSEIERDSYYGAYKGVTDILTKYLWPEIAYHLTRLAAAIRFTPNMVTAIGAVLCVLATYLFWNGHYWAGTASGFGFMVLDTVDGKLARCTITSSYWGNIFDHGIDLIHPPFWWLAWAAGLSAWGLDYPSGTYWLVMGVICGGYILQRLLEGWFIQRFGIHMHVWRKIDSDFRLITARRNPNMVLLIGGLIFARPDWGLNAVAIWTILSLLAHFGQVLQAEISRRNGLEIRSWLESG